MESTNYSDKYVLFFDILGFSHKVALADKDLNARADVHKVMTIIRDSLCHNPNTGSVFSYFSDCIVVSTNRSIEGMQDMINSIRILTCNLLNYGHLSRGALTAGLIHHDSDFVYGLPLIQAHSLEQNSAVYPRTIISEDVEADLEKYGDQIKFNFAVDNDGFVYLHYLIEYANYANFRMSPGTVVLDYSALHIIDHINNQLNQFEGRVLDKVKWFQKYWNETVAIHGIFDRIESDAPSRLPRGAANFIVRRGINEIY